MTASQVWYLYSSRLVSAPLYWPLMLNDGSADTLLLDCCCCRRTHRGRSRSWRRCGKEQRLLRGFFIQKNVAAFNTEHSFSEPLTYFIETIAKMFLEILSPVSTLLI